MGILKDFGAQSHKLLVRRKLIVSSSFSWNTQHILEQGQQGASFITGRPAEKRVLLRDGRPRVRKGGTAPRGGGVAGRYMLRRQGRAGAPPLAETRFTGSLFGQSRVFPPLSPLPLPSQRNLADLLLIYSSALSLFPFLKSGQCEFVLLIYSHKHILSPVLKSGQSEFVLSIYSQTHSL